MNYASGKNPYIKKKERRRDETDREKEKEKEDEERENRKKRKREEDEANLKEFKVRMIMEETASYQEKVKEETKLAQAAAKVDSVPLSLEEMMKKRAEEEKQRQKPVFLSKEERQRIALQERAQQAEQARSRAQREREVARREEREHSPPPSAARRVLSSSHIDEEMEKEKQLELEKIKQQYIGKKREKRKILKPSEKFKLMFEWDEEEDTLRDTLPSLVEEETDFRPQFGRGFLGGMDRSVQISQFEHRDVDQRKVDVKREEDKKKLDQIHHADLCHRHWSEKTLEDMEERDWRIFKEDFNITTKGTNIPHPIRYWEESTLPREIKDALKEAGYKDPTPIQRQAIPIALSGRDVVGIAETGSGKTAAFVLPMIVYITYQPKMTPLNQDEGPYALILAPTRELVQQIQGEAEKFAKALRYRSISLVGGIPLDQQGFQLRDGYEIVCATPGRLGDCLRRRFLVLNQCNYVVLDEADRMIDMGFEEQVKEVLDAMPTSNLKSENEEIAEKQEAKGFFYRTTIMYSATMPTAVERIARTYLRRAVYIMIGDAGKAVDKIEQRVIWTSEGKKHQLLSQLLAEGMMPPIIVFTNIKRTCDTVAKSLHGEGYRCIVLHSGKSQEQRENAISGFRDGLYDVLVATDVAGRGIDIPGVNHVINFDLPKDIEPYTHRIGRTGRAGKTGVATSFLTNEDTEIMYDLKEMLVRTGNVVPAELAAHEASKVKPGTIVTKRRRDTIIFAR